MFFRFLRNIQKKFGFYTGFPELFVWKFVFFLFVFYIHFMYMYIFLNFFTQNLLGCHFVGIWSNGNSNNLWLVDWYLFPFIVKCNTFGKIWVLLNLAWNIDWISLALWNVVHFLFCNIFIVYKRSFAAWAGLVYEKFKRSGI